MVFCSKVVPVDRMRGLVGSFCAWYWDTSNVTTMKYFVVVRGIESGVVKVEVVSVWIWIGGGASGQFDRGRRLHRPPIEFVCSLF